jgi:hypothetical protein
MKGGSRVQHDAPGGYSGSEKSAWTVKQDAEGNANGTSIFDPVLTELAYRWFAHQLAGLSTRSRAAACAESWPVS